MAAVVSYGRKGRLGVIRLERPDALNALTYDMIAGIERLARDAERDPEVIAICITGVGKAFCAGGDITNMAVREAKAVRTRVQRHHDWVRHVLTGEKPVIAAVNGAAAGAGFSVALLCDFVLMADDSYFRAGFPGLGASPDLGLALTLPRAVGMLRAKDLLMTNRRLDPAEAVACGAATRVVPAAQLMDEALALAEQLAAGPATSLGLTKFLLNQAYEPIEDFLADECMSQAVAFGSAEFDEGVKAFLGKRKPDFRKRA